MSFDGIVTRAISHELDETLSSGRVMKIYQPTSTELILTIRKNGKNHALLLSAHPSYARFHLTEESYQNPKEPPMLCMLLRKHLVSGFIEKIEQVENERIVYIHIRGKDEIGDETKRTLIIEVMGKHSNILLIDAERNMILDSIKHIPPAVNRHRIVMPGQQYVLPPSQEKVNPLSIDGTTFARKLDFNGGKLDKQILQKVQGFSPLIAQEITYRAHLGSQEKFKEVYDTIRNTIESHDYQPTIIESNKQIFYVLPLQSINGERESFNSVSDMLDRYFSGKAERDRVKQQAGDLSRLLKNERDKNKRKIKKHYSTLKRAEEADNYQRFGELLTAHMHELKHGDKLATVVDYYDPDQSKVEIELNPNKTPSENAQSYFQTYQKLKKSKQVVELEIEKAEKEIDYFEQLIQQIESAREQDIEEIREELREEGYLKAKPQSKRKKTKHKPQPEQYTSSTGTLIYVGRNNKQNEYLTNKMAARDDIWLHTKDIPGSHVVIKSVDPDEDTLFEAAQLSAFFSKSKHSSSVPVDYTKIRHVKKPSGAKPGYVIYDNQQTLFVNPDESFIRRLKENNKS